jgi:hypothetical protein
MNILNFTKAGRLKLAHHVVRMDQKSTAKKSFNAKTKSRREIRELKLTMRLEDDAKNL